MYAVIKTGGKQYRVQPGDLLVVEKLDGDVGADIAFDQVLMVAGDAGEITLGAPTVKGALVRATLIETRKGDKVKIFKKIRRQGYRRTRGHRQTESVLRVTGLEGGGLSAKWDGTVDLTPRSVLNARARGLAPKDEAPAVKAAPAKTAAPVAKAAPKPAATKAAPAPAAKPKAAAPKAAETTAPTKAKAAPKAEAAPASTKTAKAAPKTAAAPKKKAEAAAPKAKPKA
jgi:large subunit ribosomal protein L21